MVKQLLAAVGNLDKKNFQTDGHSRAWVKKILPSSSESSESEPPNTARSRSLPYQFVRV